MNRRWYVDVMVVCLVWWMSAVPGRADDGKTPAVVVPERQIEFVTVTEPYTTRLFRADPKLLEQKFAAQFQLLYPVDSRGSQNRIDASPFLGGFAGIPMVNAIASKSRRNFYARRSATSAQSDGAQTFHVFPLFRPNFPVRSNWKNTNEYFQELVKLVPEDKRPPQEILDLLKKQLAEGLIHASTGGGRRWRGNDQSEGSVRGYVNYSTMNFVIMAPTEELARQSARALLALFDEGISRYAQTNVLKARADAVKELQAARKDLEQNTQRAEAKTKALESTAAIDKSTVTDFHLRQHLLEVDLAGIRARIEAANKLLAQGQGLRSTRRDQIENLKIAAEIELAGLAAQQKALAHLIQLGKERATLEAETAKAKSIVSSYKKRVRSYEREIESYDSKLESVTPFELIDGKVTIRSVKWDSE